MDEFLNKFQNVMKFLGYTEVTVSSCDLIKGLNLSCKDKRLNSHRLLWGNKCLNIPCKLLALDKAEKQILDINLAIEFCNKVLTWQSLFF